MIRLILFLLFSIAAVSMLSSCGSVNFPPGKAIIGADGGDGF